MIVLISVDVLFLIFVIIQATYLFGGESNITAQGYTYSEYARRGFFELLAVSISAMLLVVVLDHVTTRETKHENLFRGLTVAVIILTLVMLASAYQRLSLYEDAYGFTRLRVVSHVFMIWLALLFVVLIADLFRLYPYLFWLGGMVITLLFFATLNLINVDAFIAGHNVERFRNTGKIDIYYLTTLSDDAIPAMVDLMDAVDENSTDGRSLYQHLGKRLYELDKDHDKRSFLGYHFGKARAWKALDERRDELAEYVHAGPDDSDTSDEYGY